MLVPRALPGSHTGHCVAMQWGGEWSLSWGSITVRGSGVEAALGAEGGARVCRAEGPACAKAWMLGDAGMKGRGEAGFRDGDCARQDPLEG